LPCAMSIRSPSSRPRGTTGLKGPLRGARPIVVMRLPAAPRTAAVAEPSAAVRREAWRIRAAGQAPKMQGHEQYLSVASQDFLVRATTGTCCSNSAAYLWITPQIAPSLDVAFLVGPGKTFEQSLGPLLYKSRRRLPGLASPLQTPRPCEVCLRFSLASTCCSISCLSP
jgi:hypothetical protein